MPVKDPTNKVGRPQSDYAKNNGAWRRGDSWFTEEQNVMDNRKTTQTPDGKDAGQAGRARKMQQDDLDKQQIKDVPGNTPSYKKGGIVKNTGIAKLHAGERVIPRKKVAFADKAMKKYSGKR